MDNWRRSNFFDQDEDPLGPLANLVDIILVFACGLIATLVAFSPDLQAHFDGVGKNRDLTLGEEMPAAPESLQTQMQSGGSGFEPLGQVYRDPKTGKLILIDHGKG